MWTFIKQSIFQYPLASLICFEIAFAALGYYIVTSYLMDKRIKGFLPKTIFTVTFMCSLGLLLMYLYEIFQLMISQTIWDFILAILVINCVIIIPICLLFKLPFIMIKIKIKNYKIPIFAIIVLLLFIQILTSWARAIQQIKKIQHSLDIFSKSYLNVLAQMGVTGGVYIMGLMSAYGSIWTPYVYFNRKIDNSEQRLIKTKRKTKKDIQMIIQNIKNNKYESLIIKQKIQQKEKILDNLQKNHQTSFFQGIKNALFKSKQQQSIDKVKSQIKKLQQDLLQKQRMFQTLNRVHQQSFSRFRQILQEERKHNISQTLIGKFFKLMGYILSVYSVTKIILTVWNMFVGRKLSTDPITRLLSFVAWVLGSNINSQFRLYFQYISFGFMGYLMISNVRSFSMNMKNFFDFIFRRRRLNILSTDTLVLLLSQMYGIYFLSAAILLQSGLPRTYVTNFQQITGKVLLVQHFTLFDKLYFWCCILSGIFIAFCEYQRIEKINNIIEQKSQRKQKQKQKAEDLQKIQKSDVEQRPGPIQSVQQSLL